METTYNVVDLVVNLKRTDKQFWEDLVDATQVLSGDDSFVHDHIRHFYPGVITITKFAQKHLPEAPGHSVLGLMRIFIVARHTGYTYWMTLADAPEESKPRKLVRGKGPKVSYPRKDRPRKPMLGVLYAYKPRGVKGYKLLQHALNKNWYYQKE